MNLLDAERAERPLDGIGQTLRIAGADFLSRAAMPRQIQREDAPSCGQCRLGKHPGIEIGTKPVH